MIRPVGTTCALLLCLASFGCRAGNDPAPSDRLRGLVAGGSPGSGDSARDGVRILRPAREFYATRGYRPAWVENGRPTPAFDELLAALSRADDHGLDPLDYGVDVLSVERRLADRRWFGPQFDPARLAEIEFGATQGFLEFAGDLARGRVVPRDLDRRWSGHDEAPDLSVLLAQALASNRIAGTLADLAPRHPQYVSLQQALRGYRDDAGDGVHDRARGAVATRRMRQIAMNLERWRWMPRDLGSRYVLVNLPAYNLEVYQADRPVLTMRVIVGAPSTPTPLFSDRMRYVVFSPYWNIPESIMRQETLPRVAADPDYLERAGLEIVRVSGSPGERIEPASVDWSRTLTEQGYRLRQAPGPENALGLVKFIFPNHFNVYLHDTPGGDLFRRSRRALSHGCIRLENPVALAKYVLSDQPVWDRARITAAMQAGEETIAPLTDTLPVHLGYWTAWTHEDGRVVFTGDPYGVDARHARARDRLRHRERITREARAPGARSGSGSP